MYPPMGRMRSALVLFLLVLIVILSVLIVLIVLSVLVVVLIVLSVLIVVLSVLIVVLSVVLVLHNDLHSAAVRQHKIMVKFPCRLRQKWVISHF